MLKDEPQLKTIDMTDSRKPRLDLKSFDSLISRDVEVLLTNEESAYLKEIFARFDGYPSLEQMWQLMDEPWVALGCDPNTMDTRITSYYQHPVWMLNGLFIEQHDESLAHRHAFANWIVQQSPLRVADFGGGFGGLARIIGEALPSTQVEVIEPHPRPVAVAMAANTPNVRFVSELTGEYDLLIATDVFEHVPDPLALCAETARHLKPDGQYLIANCFRPVIKCHLPQLFHFVFAWDASMTAMGLQPEDYVRYGRSYRRSSHLDLQAARGVSEVAKKLYAVLRYLPRGRVKLGESAMKLHKILK